jgi:CheY-like chemotaxis protein
MKATSLDFLHVDDDSNDRLLMKAVCQALDASINSADLDNGKKAIDYLDGVDPFSDRGQFPLPRIILLDLKMPLKTGFEVLDWIRGQPAFKYLPVIILTASKQEADMRRAYDLGANAFVVKPNTMTALKEVIKTMKAFWLVWNEEPASDVSTIMLR